MLEFKEVVTADKAANTKANGLWGKMVSYCQQLPEQFREVTDGKAKAMSDYLNNRVKEAREQDHKWDPSNAFRSNKSLILRAIRLGVNMVDSRDQPRGKTEVQDTCNELEKKDLSPFDQFMAAVNMVSKKLDKLEQGQKVTAIAAISELANRVRRQITGEQEKKAA